MSISDDEVQAAADRDIIARARGLFAVTGTAAVKEHTGETDAGMAYAVAYGGARQMIGQLLAVIDRLGGPRRLDTAWCKRCMRTTPSGPCPRCGGLTLCAGCGRCPPCDGPVPDKEEDDEQ